MPERAALKGSYETGPKEGPHQIQETSIESAVGKWVFGNDHSRKTPQQQAALPVDRNRGGTTWEMAWEKVSRFTGTK